MGTGTRQVPSTDPCPVFAPDLTASPFFQAMKVLSKKKLMRQAGFPRKWHPVARQLRGRGHGGLGAIPTPFLPFLQAARRPVGPKAPQRAACSPRGPSSRSTRKLPS